MKIFNKMATMLICVVVTSCTLDKTDYEAELNTAIPEAYEFEEMLALDVEGYHISLEALNGTLYKGYNEVHGVVSHIASNENISNAEVYFLPIRANASEVYSCPHQYQFNYQNAANYFSSYVVFDEESGVNGSWQLYFTIVVDGQELNFSQEITVVAQPNMNLNMTAFTGNDGEQYYIALIAPVSPNVAENELVAGIYQYQQPTVPAGDFPDPSQFSFSQVANYTLALDPRMPEPSMGNHSSPNNQDLTQMSDGLYYGVVNYTMTGNWTLNFILSNAAGEVMKGTNVSTDFTPGIEGEKSELYIDILF